MEEEKIELGRANNCDVFLYRDKNGFIGVKSGKAEATFVLLQGACPIIAFQTPECCDPQAPAAGLSPDRIRKIEALTQSNNDLQERIDAIFTNSGADCLLEVDREVLYRIREDASDRTWKEIRAQVMAFDTETAKQYRAKIRCERIAEAEAALEDAKEEVKRREAALADLMKV